MMTIKETSRYHKKNKFTNNFRNLGASEKLALRINKITPHNIVTCTELEGNISITQIKHNFNICRKKNPLLRCTIINNKFVFTKVLPKFIYHKENSLPSILYAQRRMQILISKRLDEKAQPPVYIELVEFYNNKFFLFVTIQHTIADGVSVAFLTKHLLGSSVKPTSINKFDNFPLEYLIPPLPAQLVENKVSVIKSTKKLANLKTVLNHSTGMKILELDTSITDKICAFCKEKKFSVTSFLTACFSLTLSIIISEKTNTYSSICCNILINLRRYLTTPISDENLGFYSGYIPIIVGLEQIGSPEQVSQKIHKELYGKLNNTEQFIMTSTYDELADPQTSDEDLLNTIKVESPSVGISNMGIIKDGALLEASLKIKTMHIGVTSHPYSRNENTFFVCIITCKGKMSINIHYPLFIFSTERAEALAGLFKKILCHALKYQSEG